MVDKFSKETRSYIMSRIRSSNTKSELRIKALLDGRVMRYQPKMPRNPDFGSKKYRVAVFIDGCFWHGCPRCYREPKTNKKFWKKKIGRNKERDVEYTRDLKKMGYKVLRFWEHQLINDENRVVSRINKVIEDAKKIHGR